MDRISCQTIGCRCICHADDFDEKVAGRPRKVNGGTFLTIYLEANLKERLKAFAKATGINVSDWSRKELLKALDAAELDQKLADVAGEVEYREKWAAVERQPWQDRHAAEAKLWLVRMGVWR
jgi:hypothetical protein